MDFQRRRLAVALEPLLSTPAISPRDARLDSTATLTETPALPGSTIAPYDTGLNGVNQSGNYLVRDLLWWTLGIAGLCVLIIRITELVWAKFRQVTAMHVPGDKQGFWKIKQWDWMPGMKRRLIYAPLWRKRHNREFRLSSAVNMGTLPSRFHSLLLGLYLASNLAYMFLLNWQNENKYAFCAELRGRSGMLALVNMVPLTILAGRNNPLISILQISFDTYNLLHRWMGRVVVIEALIHTIAWAIVQVADGGWESVHAKMLHNRFIASGSVGTLAMIFLLILSVSPLRHAFYETFLSTHIILAFITFVCTLVHCASASIPGGLPQLPWIIAIMLLWFAERLARMVRLAYCNWSERGYTEAVVEPMPGETCRVTLRLPQYIDIKPGTHAYLRFAGVNAWENHPFSIAWVEHAGHPALPTNEKELATLERPTTTSVSFVIGAQTGFTRKLYDTAIMAQSPAVRLRAAFEGPYAGHHCLDSYGHVVLFAGATGITHQISYLKHLIDGCNTGVVATRRITLVWIIRDYEALEWVRPWMDTILRLPNRKEILQIKLFITRPKNSREIGSASNTVRIFPGRPNIPMLLRREVHEQVGAMCVSVCGPGGLADDVRSAARMVQEERQVVDFIEESFTW